MHAECRVSVTVLVGLCASPVLPPVEVASGDAVGNGDRLERGGQGVLERKERHSSIRPPEVLGKHLFHFVTVVRTSIGASLIAQMPVLQYSISFHLPCLESYCCDIFLSGTNVTRNIRGSLCGTYGDMIKKKENQIETKKDMSSQS